MVSKVVSKTIRVGSNPTSSTNMIIYKPTGQIFNNRKEAKKYFGTNNYCRLEKDKKDLLFITNNFIATNETEERRTIEASK